MCIRDSSYAYVSREAAALFGDTVEEFMEVTGGTAVGAVYPPDLEQALADCAEAFRDGGLSYSTRYRVRCRDGSLKWVIDSGKKALDGEGSWMVNSLYLDVTRAEEDAQRLREQTQLLTSIYDTVPCGIIPVSYTHLDAGWHAACAQRMTNVADARQTDAPAPHGVKTGNVP